MDAEHAKAFKERQRAEWDSSAHGGEERLVAWRGRVPVTIGEP